MPEIGQVYYNVIDKNSGACISSGPSIFKDDTPGQLVGRYGAKWFTKIGIQAKPGTIVILNQNKTVMIGQSGIYELEEDDIKITDLYFIRPINYTRDNSASDSLIQEGIEKIKQAEKEFQEKVKITVEDTNQIVKIQVLLNGDWCDEPEKDSELFDDFWNAYSKAKTTFLAQYTEGISELQMGRNGVYKLPNPDNIEAEENYGDLYDVIIDFIYEKA